MFFDKVSQNGGFNERLQCRRSGFEFLQQIDVKDVFGVSQYIIFQCLMQLAEEIILE